MTIQIDLPLIAHGSAGPTRMVHVVREGDAETLARLLGRHEKFLRAQGFDGRAGDFTLLPAEDGEAHALFCIAENAAPLSFGILAGKLPAGDWTVSLHGLKDAVIEDVTLGFCAGAYRYHVRGREAAKTRLVLPPCGLTNTVALARANWLGRDLINSPANLLGPQELAQEAADALESRGANVTCLTGDALQAAYPCLAAVGAGSDRPPAVLIARWKAREGARRVSLVGKGVCFDTGGYDVKPSASMLRMKKDMGGAALMLAVMCAAIDAKLDVALELRLGCVENSISGHAMRPGDVLTTRSGLTVEIGNTDAEGRLVLCDLLTEAAETQPDCILDAATLTGAARVALGPDLPALFSNDDALAGKLLESGRRAEDPLWRMPLWHGYDAWLKSAVADCNNVSSFPMAGAITAALYLQRFLPEGQKWAHIDTYAWNDAASPGRPAGGETLGLRAIFGLLS